MHFKISIVIAAGLAIFSSGAFAQDGLFACPDGEQARVMFKDGRMATYPSYAEGDGARVQKQHPETYLFAQAKFRNAGFAGVGICQYSNHVGWVAMFAADTVARSVQHDGCQAGTCNDIPRWRSEHTNASPQHDRPGQETIFVCVKDKNGIAHPSAACRFQMTK